MHALCRRTCHVGDEAGAAGQGDGEGLGTTHAARNRRLTTQPAGERAAEMLAAALGEGLT